MSSDEIMLNRLHAKYEMRGIMRQVASELLGHIPVEKKRIIAKESKFDVTVGVLAEDKDPITRVNAVKNPQFNRQEEGNLWYKLLHDENESVSEAAARKTEGEFDIQQHLAKHKNHKIRKIAAEMSKDAETLRKLAKDEDPEVAETARKNPNAPPDLRELPRA